MEKDQSTEILKQAILMEMRGKSFYETVASQTPHEEVKKIFSMMAGEEQSHIEFLSKQFSSYKSEKKFVPIDFPTEEGVAELILSPEVKQQISAAGYEAAAISAAIDMETKAIEVYSKRASEAIDPNEKKLYQWLADWEKGHHKILHELNEELKQSIWFDNHFWPF
ncbi:MAG: ferritin family protein [Lentimicrobiaceae bacterium]|nr:ferritin family protein [Lentimicrobiaceae bacterium]